jgi:hypothetical protein
MTQTQEIKKLLAEYKEKNPDLVDPASNLYLLGTDGLLDLLKKADNRPIEFIFKDGNYDYFEVRIDGAPVDIKL